MNREELIQALEKVAAELRQIVRLYFRPVTWTIERIRPALKSQDPSNAK